MVCFQAKTTPGYVLNTSIKVTNGSQTQDTVKSSQPENKVTKRASAITICVTIFFNLACGCFGYTAFGNDTPGNLLTGFGFYEPY
ncbi:putative amino acid transporter, transmembrane domain-containing protein [Helianthus annuus]|nr:putative amino acid transporter, transmembrane domain-containing protein [Helianthus annuus]